jgi:hypothetical protein
MKRLTLAAMLLFAPLLALAQDQEPALKLGDFENRGAASFGYRFVDLSGYQPKYQELFNLNGGPRLLQFDLFGKAAEGANKFADDYSITTNGWGGEPFASSQLTLRKRRVYDLRVNFRRSYYYWDRNDAATLPVTVNGLTSNHNWATVRKLGSANLLVHATNNLKFSFEYYRNTRDGVNMITRSPDYFGSSSVWASFSRANPYLMVAPFSESSNRVTGGMDYSVRDWSVHFRSGYQRFESSVNGANAQAAERSINTSDASTAAELLNGAAWTDTRKLTTPVTEFSYTGRAHPRVQLRGGYMFYRYAGPASLAMSFDGIARTNSTATTVGPYAVFQSSTAQVSEPNHVFDQGFTVRINDWWDTQVDYRYARFSSYGETSFRSLTGTVVATGDSTGEWQVGTSNLDVNMNFTPGAKLVIRPGVRLMKSDVKSMTDGVVDPARTRRIKSFWPMLSAYYQPVQSVSIRADIEQINNGTSYTRITPHIDLGGRVVFRYKPTARFTLEDTVVARNRELISTAFKNHVRSNAITATYDINSKYAGYAGMRYDSILTSNYVNFLRGTAPFTNVGMRDQTIDRIWMLGVRARPIAPLEFNFTGNYTRTTGRGEITGEAPLYGPMTFPYATGSASYDFPHLGRLMIQLQRTYYSEEIVPGNNFGAKILMVSWTREF